MESGYIFIVANMRENEAEYYMTVPTRNRLESWLRDMSQKLSEAGSKIGETGGKSDYHDNFAFEQANRDYAELMGKYLRIQDRVKYANIIVPNNATDIIGIGHEVEMQSVTTHEVQTFTIVGPLDSNPDVGWVSFLTVVGRSLMGKTSGNILELLIDEGVDKNVIVDFRPGMF